MQCRLLAANNPPNSPYASTRRRNREQSQVRAFLAPQEGKQANVWSSGKGSERLVEHGSVSEAGAWQRAGLAAGCRDAKLQSSHQTLTLGLRRR
jgi:hypothetical protein